MTWTILGTIIHGVIIIGMIIVLLNGTMIGTIISLAQWDYELTNTNYIIGAVWGYAH